MTGAMRKNPRGGNAFRENKSGSPYITSTDNKTRRLDTSEGWVVTLASMLCLALGPSAVLVTGCGVFIHPVADTFHWSIDQVSFAVNLIALSLTFIAPLQGLLLDRFGARRLVLYSIPCLGGGLIAMRWLPNSYSYFMRHGSSYRRLPSAYGPRPI